MIQWRQAYIAPPNIFPQDSRTPWWSNLSHTLTFITAVNPRGNLFSIGFGFCSPQCMKSRITLFISGHCQVWISSWGMKFVNFIKKTCPRAFVFFTGQNTMYEKAAHDFTACLVAQLSPMKTEHVRTHIIYSLISEHGVPHTHTRPTHRARQIDTKKLLQCNFARSSEMVFEYDIAKLLI